VTSLWIAGAGLLFGIGFCLSLLVSFLTIGLVIRVWDNVSFEVDSLLHRLKRWSRERHRL
jgi:hypothetical protein